MITSPSLPHLFQIKDAHPPIDLLMLDYEPTKKNLIEMGKLMEDLTVPKGHPFFSHHTLRAGQVLTLKPNQELQIFYNGVQQAFTPFVEIDAEAERAQYGLLPSAALNHGRLNPLKQAVDTQMILDHATPEDIVFLYACLPHDRNQMGMLKVKFNGQWLHKKNSLYQWPVLGRSRRERFDPKVSLRLAKDGDTPQGIYQVHGTFFTDDKKFGAVPRIDIDGMKKPLNLEEPDLTLFSQLVPRLCFNDFWTHEFVLSYLLGRYLFRIHDNNLDPKLPNTYTPPNTKLDLRPTAGCINTVESMHTLLKTLCDLDVLSHEHIDTSAFYGRLSTEGQRPCYLIVLDL